ncbi:MAG: nitroreductase family deazaflavin-dependent oxidoreductase [Anaerolineae bacterium]|uniref:nitroreductase family deazaflavin-dependent oxidoreductase n=1 Tax=Promineifilum sp. TaxID=2664178 RepID=UPI001E0231C1|nr:nitroreductase family deazaflavin-dependent oxidoreductase [Anaerolineales bacterium]MCB8935459.1 nitroreductase family deazaflavin-dependent oxidoreductase [Promineifilum sp.]MCO5180512.1 nitroreductase family deazaflavin-dependent oxidoreductase [Promineifilum sp.]MCW5847731.1 nitroreductase family deazaflavin-dependent oxidoreductase [Anaerolineae bacterium]
MTTPTDSPHPVQRFVRGLIATRPAARLLAHTIPHIDRAVFRLSGGRTTAAALFTGLPILTLTTTGAKSGRPRAVTLVGIPDGERIILIASNWGQASNPAWYYNVKGYPQVTVSRDGRTDAYTARELSGQQRETAWARAVALYPGYRGYAARAGGRTIPVIMLEPRGAN